MDNKKNRNYNENVEIKEGSNNLDDFVRNTPKVGNEIRGSGQNINTSLEEFAEDVSKIDKEMVNNDECGNKNDIDEKLKKTTKKTLNEFAEESKEISKDLEDKSKRLLDKTKNKFEEFASDTASQLKRISKNIADKTKDTINKITKK